MFVNKDHHSENNSNINFDIAEHESTIFIDTSQHLSNHLLFNGDLINNQITNNNSNGGNKATGTTKNSQKKFNYRQPPPIKKTLRTTNNELSIEEIQANLPSVLIINANNSSINGNKTKLDATTIQKSTDNHLND
jgi:hypothetical protein